MTDHRGKIPGVPPHILKSIFRPESLDIVKSIIDEQLEKARQVLFPELDLEEFYLTKLYPSSPIYALLKCFVFKSGVLDEILCEKFINHLKETLGDEIFFFNSPFVRVTFPSLTSNGKNRFDNFSFGSLHYDFYEGLDHRTFWIPLHEIDSSTGSLIYTTDLELIKLCGLGLEDVNYHSGKNEGLKELWPLVKERCQTILCKKGDAVTFKKDLLHGSSYPVTKPRYSIDIRFFSKNDPKLEKVKKNYDYSCFVKTFIPLENLKDRIKKEFEYDLIQFYKMRDIDNYYAKLLRLNSRRTLSYGKRILKKIGDHLKV
ncbi:hypothetical protein OAK75_13800 [Bacteriovoracales bacterium]|nr:hypothetical protein [Bacteriovoracales bacterium]